MALGLGRLVHRDLPPLVLDGVALAQTVGSGSEEGIDDEQPAPEVLKDDKQPAPVPSETAV